MIREIICRIFGHKWASEGMESYWLYKGLCRRCYVSREDWKRQNREMMK